MNKDIKENCFLSGLILGLVVCLFCVLMILFVKITEFNNIKERLIQKDFAEYDTKSGEFQWLNKDVKFVFKGDE